MSRRVRRFGLPTWPSEVWTRLGSGHRWLCLVRAASAFVWVRERGEGAVFHKLFLGRPMPCDPDTEYEVRNIGYLSDTATAQTPASVATTVQAPAAGGLATGEAPMRTNADAVVLSTPEPLYGGELHVRLSVVATASVSTQYAFRLTTEGLRSLSVLTHALGTDTLTNHYLALSDADAPGTYDGNWNFLVTGGAMGSGANLIINLGDTGLPIIQSQGADYKTTPPRERAMYLVTTTHVAGVSLRVDVHGTAGL